MEIIKHVIVMIRKYTHYFPPIYIRGNLYEENRKRKENNSVLIFLAIFHISTEYIKTRYSFCFFGCKSVLLKTKDTEGKRFFPLFFI